MRRKILAALATICALLGTAALTACGDKNEHEHIFESGWTNNDIEHWHNCTYQGCNETSDRANHDGEYIDGVYQSCSVCDYVKPSNDPDDPNKPSDPNDPDKKPDDPDDPNTPTTPDTGDGAFKGVSLSEAGVLSWNKIKGASKYVITVTYSGASSSVSYDIDKSKTAQDLNALRAEGFPSGKSQVTLAAYEIDSVKIDGETVVQEVPMTNVRDMFRVTVLNGKFSLARLKYSDEHITLDGFYAEKATGANGDKYYLYELALKDNKATRLNLSSYVKAVSGGAVKFYKSAEGRENNDSSDAYSSNDLMFLYFNHGENKIYVRAANDGGTADYDLCVYGLYTVDIERYGSAFTVSNGLRTYSHTKMGETLTVTERDIITADVLYDGITNGKLGRTDSYDIVEKSDIEFELSGSEYPDASGKLNKKVYFYDADTVRADCTEYADYSSDFSISESDYGISLSTSGSMASGAVTVPYILVGRPVISAQFFMSDVTTVYIAEGATAFVARFSYCSNITDIWLPSTITDMNEFAFGGNSLDILPTNMAIHCAFDKALADTFPSKWNQIAGKTQYYNTIYGDSRPVTVGGIEYKIAGGSATVNGAGGTDVTIPDTVTVNGKVYDVTAVSSISASGNIKLGKNVTDIAKNAFSRAVGKIEVDAENSAFAVSDGVLYTADGTRMIVAQTDVGSVFVESADVDIDDNAFAYCAGATLYVGADEYDCYKWDDCNFDDVRLVYNVSDFVEVDDFSYAFYMDNNTWDTVAVLLAYNGNAATVTVPSEVNGYAVTEIASKAFENKTALTEVIIPDSVENMGDKLFVGCSSLKKITMPFLGSSKTVSKTMLAATGLGTDSAVETVALTQATELHYRAFNDYINIKSISLPDTIVAISGSAFDGCTGLQYNEYSGARYLGNAENGYAVLIKVKDANIATATVHADTRVICGGAFENCSALTALTVPETVQAIGVGAFGGCNGLQSISLPFAGSRKPTSRTATDQQLKTVFGGAVPSALKSVTIDGCDYISVGAFDGCAEVTEIVVGDSVKGIGAGAFNGCTGLLKVTLGGGLKDLDNNATGDTSPFRDCDLLEEIVINGNSKYLFENGIFYTPIGIQHVLATISGDVVIRADGALSTAGIGGHFQNRDKITSLVIPTNVTKIAQGAFKGCSGLTKITIPFVGTVKNSNQFAEYEFCRIFGTLNDVPMGLEEVVITGGTKIGMNAFQSCKMLRRVTIGASIKTISRYAFSDCVANGNTTLQAITLENKTGWKVNGTSYTESQLTPSAVANMMGNTHYDALWERSDS